MNIGLTDGPEIIIVQCNKIALLSGFLEASVNSEPLSKITECDLYGLTIDNKTDCIQINTAYNVELKGRNFKLDFECKLNGSSSDSSIKYSIYKTSK